MNINEIDRGKIANKKFGQNFLEDESVLEQIIQAMPDDNLPVVEIGPGLGDLTKKLVQVRQVVAFEVDDRLCLYLKKLFSQEIADGKLQLICGDVLEQWTKGSLLEYSYHLVANLPYYIATTIILKALRDENCKSTLTMVQKEVANKFSALVDDRNFSALSVLAQSAGEAQISLLVPPQAFNPAPKVDSAVLKIQKTDTLKDNRFEDFLKVAFKQPRKTLIKNLSSLYPKSTIETLFQRLALERTIRPHQVETMLYHQIYYELTKEYTYGKESKNF